MNSGMSSKGHRTPFTSRGAVVFDASGEIVAVLDTNVLAGFVVSACNDHAALKQIARLCRGEVESEDETYLYRSAAHLAMRDLFGRLDCTVLRG